MTTIRSLMLAQQARHRQDVRYDAQWCVYCDEPGPCADRVAADAVLATLDAAELISEYPGGEATEKSHWRHVPDPEAS